MAFLKSIIDKVLSREEDIEQDYGDHYDRLDRLRRNHDFIDVKITNTEKMYQSMVLEIDPDDSELVIDELFPPEGLDNIQTGDTVEINSRSRRVFVSFYTRILAHETRDGSPVYRLELPEEVGMNHGRTAYRVYVDREEGLEITLNNEDTEEQYEGVRIINLSADGIKLNFSEDITDELTKHNLFKNSVIHLPTGYDIDCDIDLRNAYRIRTPYPHSLSGGVLTIHHSPHRAKLDQFLASVQRKQRRRELRLT